jgi:hypothetical protein
MTVSRAEVEQLAKAQFPELELALVLSILDEYGRESHEQERARVQVAILKLSAGDEGKLLHNVAAAKQDYRDVLMWSEEPAPTSEEAATEVSMVERILKAFGGRQRLSKHAVVYGQTDA